MKEKNNDRVINKSIVDTLTENYMPYAMSVIISRAIPEIDGFKPSHRKILYTMYKMGLLNGNRTKSANIVGQTMKLNPHGDNAIYETMVRLSKGSEYLLCPFVDSKGNFGKVYSRDMAYAASRYTEAKLSSVCQEIFCDIDCDSVDFVNNYDGQMKEPTLLPTTFPNILVSANTGIAVSMASSFCGFNLTEVCKATIAYIKDPKNDIFAIMPAPDFTTGGEIILDPDMMKKIYNEGKGGFKVRCKWQYIKKENLIEVLEIPYTTTIEAIMDKTAELIKAGRIKEIFDMRDETDLNGLKIAIDLKRGVDPERLMQKMFKMTTLMDSFSCNFNLLINGVPRVLGVYDILNEWVLWRMKSIKRRISFDINRKKDRLHLLLGLKKILLDIDKAIQIIRQTEEESQVVPNLMSGFGIDEIQADYVAELKLRNINKQYILKRVSEVDELQSDILDLGRVVKSNSKIKDIIIKELEHVIKKYPSQRKSTIVYHHEINQFEEDDSIEDYSVNLFISKHGYFKKITMQSLRMSSEQKLKEGDFVSQSFKASNKDEIMFFTNMQRVYKAHLYDFDDCKASLLGDYLPSKFCMDGDEKVLFMLKPGDYTGYLLVCFENGKIAKINMSAYNTKSNRKKLTGAFSDKEGIVSFLHIKEDCEIALYSAANRCLVLNTAVISSKSTRNTQGISVMVLRGNNKMVRAVRAKDSGLKNASRYRSKTIPVIGVILKDEDLPDSQMML